MPRTGRSTARSALLPACLLAVALALMAVQGGARADERVHVDVHLADPIDAAEFDALLDKLAELGLEIELALPDLGRLQGWITFAQIEALRSTAGIDFVGAPHYALAAAGSAISEGDEALGAAAARERFGVDGSGVRVAVISDGIQGLDLVQEHGDAPLLVEARAFGSGRLDRGAEGTAMLELVHDLAPGAALSFGAVATDLDMIAAVRYFAQRVDVIVDDLGFIYPDDQQSDVSRNTAEALANPVWPLRAYITAAGNQARNHWSGTFNAGGYARELGLPNPGPVHVWWRNAALNRFRLRADEQVVIALHWNEPWGRAKNDFDLYLISPSGEIAAASTGRQAINTFDPQETLIYQNTGGDGRFAVVVQNWRGAAAALELELFVLVRAGGEPDTSLEAATAASSLLAQSDAGGGVITVAAITQNVAGLSRVADYSGQGPTNNGAAKPDIAAVDGVRISGATDFGSRFYGTSAAAPHVAAVAALLLQAQPSLLAADGGTADLERERLRELLLGTAVDIGPDGFDLRSGAGRIDAEAAIEAAQREIVLVSSTADRGAGTLREAIHRVNDGDASQIAFADMTEPDAHVIRIESPLPPLERNGATLDGAGWRIDASVSALGLVASADDVTLAGIEVGGAADAGIVSTGRRARIIGARVAGNGRGLLIAAGNADVRQLIAVGNRGAGVVVAANGSARISDSWIGIDPNERDNANAGAHGNGGAGVRVNDGAGPVIIGASQPMMPVDDTGPPIAPLGLPELEPRSGALHTISGILLIDGLPAPPGTALNLWLDRRAAGHAVVGPGARFSAAVAGPGELIRFSLNGVPLKLRLHFQSGGSSRLLLRAEQTERLADTPVSTISGTGNRIAFNAGPGVSLAPQTSEVIVRGNRIWSNGGPWIAADAERTAPRIRQIAFARGAATIYGEAFGAASVDLYTSNGEGAAQYRASAAVTNSAFRFERIDVGGADRFWVLAHDAGEAVLAVSAGWAAAPEPRIATTSPVFGGYLGGEAITIRGEHFQVGASAPSVFIGGAEAVVRSSNVGQIIVEAPPTNWLGPADITVLRPDGRLATLPNGYRYDRIRRTMLQPGWNSVAWLGGATRITAALSAIAPLAAAAYHWSPVQQRWLAFSPEVPPSLNTLQRLDTGDVLWLRIEGDRAITWPQLLPWPLS